MTLTEFLLQRIAEDEAYIGQILSRIVELHAASQHPLTGSLSPYTKEPRDLGIVCDECSGFDDPYIDQVKYPCPTLLILALPYADHPDYREEWAL